MLKSLKSYTLEQDEVEFVYGALRFEEKQLTEYKSWLQTQDGATLPGAEIAIAEVEQELKRFRAIASRMYFACFIQQATPSTQQEHLSTPE